MADRAALAACVRRQVVQSAGINAVLSIGFFLLLFGKPGRMLALDAPDRLALDFVPQAGMIGLMSALVPPLVARRELAMLTGAVMPATATIGRKALGWALAALVAGGLAAGLALALPVAEIGGWTALAIKTGFGALLGAFVTARALPVPAPHLPS